jgi:hypothetical protein
MSEELSRVGTNEARDVMSASVEISPSLTEQSEDSGSEDPSLLTPTETAMLVSSVMQDYQDWKTARSRLEKVWQDCWEAYLCDIKSLYTQPDEHAGFRSQIARPVLYEAVEAIHSFLINVLLPGDEKFFSVVGKTEADHEKAQIIEAFLRQKLQETGFYEKYSLFLKQAIVIGNSVAAVPWRQKTRKSRETRPITLFGVTVGREKIETESIVYEGPDFEVLDMFDFLIDPDEPDFENAKIIRRVERSLAELKRSGVYQNLDDLHPQVSAEDSHKTSKRQAFGISSGILGQSATRKQNVTLYEAWGDFFIGEKYFENYVCVVANGNRLIRFEPNPYDCGMKPFVFTTFVPVPNEVYGIGAIEKSLGLQHAINTLTNQKLDVINISINNPFTYLINDDVFDPDTVVTRPGALIPVKSHDTLRPIQYLNNFTVAFNEIADLKEEINQATGAFKFLTGDMSSDAGRTATEVTALVSGGHQKFSSFTKHLENTSLEPALQLVFEHAKQFLNKPETLRLVREDCSTAFQQILPGLLQAADCQFKIVGSEATLLKAQELAALLEFIRLVQSDPMVREQVDVTELYKKIYRRLGFRDEMKLFQSDMPPGMPPMTP